MEQFNYYRKQTEKELDKIAILNDIEKKTGVPKFYLVSGVLGVGIILVFLNFAASFVTNLVGFVYPAYASFKALESSGKDDDTLWLTYWVVYAFFNVLEYFSDWLLFWLPFYFFFKLCFLVYLFHPQTKGALFIYNSFIRQFLSKHERIIDEKTRQYTDQATKKVQETLDSNPTAKLAANMGTAMANDALKNMTEHSE